MHVCLQVAALPTTDAEYIPKTPPTVFTYNSARASKLMTHLYLIRHGRTTWNDEGRMQGWADPPLDGVGRQQAQALAARLVGARFDARLRERNIGDWTGLTFEEARARDPQRFEADWRRMGPPGGENQADLAA